MLRSVGAGSALAAALLGFAAAPAGAEIAPFGALTGGAHPFNGQSVGLDAAPALGDLDGDGDLDLITGNLAGTFAVHYFPEPTRGLALGIGAALLGWLDRRRRERRD